MRWRKSSAAIGRLAKPPLLRSGLSAGCSRLPHFVGEAKSWIVTDNWQLITGNS